MAREYGITKSAVSDIKRGKTWTHITLDDDDSAALGRIGAAAYAGGI